jgi:hypothetical protein
MPAPGIEPMATLTHRFTSRYPGVTMDVGAAFTPSEVVDRVRGDQGLSSHVIIRQLRSAAVDLLQASGLLLAGHERVETAVELTLDTSLTSR